MAQQTPSACESLTFPLDMLSDELQNRVLYHLPTDDSARYKSVCKEWQLGVEAWAHNLPMDYTLYTKKPFYFMYNSKATCPWTYTYISDKKRWVPFKLLKYDHEQLVFPCDLLHHCDIPFNISASGGLVCLMHAESQENICICNPILKDQMKLLPKAPCALSDYCGMIALSTNVYSRKYIVAIIRSSEVTDRPYTQKVSIQLYKSETRSWVNLHNEITVGWRVDYNCVICKDVLYSVVQFPYRWCAIVSYDLSQGKQNQSLARTMVRVPCRLTSVRLLNLNDKLIMVGAIQKQGTIEGIGIWEMWGIELREISRAPKDLMNHFRGIIGYTFLSSGCGSLVFIQAYNSPLILTYEFSNNTWAYLTKVPVSWLTDGSNYFNGFCFEPRLDIVP